MHHVLPDLALLGVYSYPEMQCRWLYSFAAQTFLQDTALHAALAELGDADKEAFVVQHAHYTEAVSCHLRVEDALIAAISGRHTTNSRTLEYVLRQHSPELLALAGPPQSKKRARKASPSPSKEKPKPKPKAKPKAVKAAQAPEVPPQAPSAASWAPPTWEAHTLVKALSQREHSLTFQVQAKQAAGPRYLSRLLEPTRVSAADWLRHASDCADPAELATYTLLSEPAVAQTVLLRPWVAGVSLRTLVGRMGKIPLKQSLVLLDKIAQQLLPFHQKGRAHLNLTPDNILINPQREVMLVDSGLTQFNRPLSPGAPVSELLAGDPLFMAPEQRAGDPGSPATDFFALGVVLVYMLCGDQAFSALSPHDSVAVCRDRLNSLAHAELHQRAQIPARDVILDLLSASESERAAGFFKLMEALKTQGAQV